jgi:hypothetical protein
MKTYYPYKATDGKHKYYIITKTGRKLYFGADGYNDYTIYYKEYGKEFADKKKKAYIARHKTNENWTKSGIDTAGFWYAKLLWNKPTIKDSYADIQKRFL